MPEQPRIAEGRTYVIKSCRPTIHPVGTYMHWMGSELNPGDREFMVVGAGDHSFRTQRPRHSATKLALVQPIVHGDMLTLRASGFGKVTFPLKKKGRPAETTRIWGDRVRALVYHEASEFFSDLLHQPCQLVRQDGARFINRGTVSKLETVSFADRYPLVGISNATLGKLRMILGGIKIPMDPFRPNLIFEGCNAQDENRWEEASLGSVRIRGVKPCTRCEMVDVDQGTAQYRKHILRVLAAEFRGAKDAPVFGENFLPNLGAPILIGSAVEVTKQRECGWDRDYDEHPHFGKLGIYWRVAIENLFSRFCPFPTHKVADL